MNQAPNTTDPPKYIPGDYPPPPIIYPNVIQLPEAAAVATLPALPPAAVFRDGRTPQSPSARKDKDKDKTSASSSSVTPHTPSAPGTPFPAGVGANDYGRRPGYSDRPLYTNDRPPYNNNVAPPNSGRPVRPGRGPTIPRTANPKEIYSPASRSAPRSRPPTSKF